MNPLLVDIPMKLETERLFLRAPRQSGDGSIVNEGIMNSFHELKAWLPFAQTLPTVEETESNLSEAYKNFLTRKSLRFLIFHKDNKEFVGVTSFEDINWNIPKCQIGYWVNTTCGGNGFMLEAVKKLTEFALTELQCKRIEIRCETTNLKSRAIPEKIGFELEGILKNEDLSADGSRLTDTCIYALVPKM